MAGPPLTQVLQRLPQAALTRYVPVYGAPQDSVSLTSESAHAATVEEVSEGFAEGIGLRVVAGRPATDAREAVLSADLAERLAGGAAEALLGATVRVGDDAVRVVGIAEPASWGFGGFRPTVYQGWRPETVDDGYLVLPPAAGTGIVDVARALEGTGLAVASFATLRGLIVRAHVLTFFLTRIALLFGAIALVVALVGVYAHLHRWMRTRQREMSVRYALGAAPARLRGRVLRLAAGRIAAGLAAGAILAAITGRLLAVIGAPAATPVAWLGALALVAGAALLAALPPAVRPITRDPLELLRARDG